MAPQGHLDCCEPLARRPPRRRVARCRCRVGQEGSQHPSCAEQHSLSAAPDELRARQIHSSYRSSIPSLLCPSASPVLHSGAGAVAWFVFLPRDVWCACVCVKMVASVARIVLVAACYLLLATCYVLRASCYLLPAPDRSQKKLTLGAPHGRHMIVPSLCPVGAAHLRPQILGL